jgi:tetrapyrrole methylase family protein/MazG family protein
MENTHDCSGDFDRVAIEAIEAPCVRLQVLMKRLLDAGGCPWDREQTHESLAQYLIEEAYEVVEAIEDGNDRDLCEELGDVGLQVVFHAELAARADRFDLGDVYDGVCRKLLDRHPHVFGDEYAEDADTVLENWEQIKKGEKLEKARMEGKSHVSVLSGVPRSLPALQRASRLQEKASSVGFDWVRVDDVCKKVCEEIGEFLEIAGQAGNQASNQGRDFRNRLDEEFGDLLFSLVNLSRFLDIRAEESLRRACGKFRARFEQVELNAGKSGRQLDKMTLEEMDLLWDQVKTTAKKSESAG